MVFGHGILMVLVIPADFSGRVLFSSFNFSLCAMRIIIAEHTCIVAIMQCQRVTDSVRDLGCRFNIFGAELDPIAIFKRINYAV